MKKRIAVLHMVVALFFLTACVGGSRLYSDDDTKAEARLEQVIEAIENQDKDTLEAMFSEQALNEAEDLDGRMDYLFGFIQGNIESYEALVSGATSESNNYGHKIKKSKSWYKVKTDKEEYLFFLLEYTENTDHPENVGLYMLQVIKAEDRETQFDGGQDILCAGIYHPDILEE